MYFRALNWNTSVASSSPPVMNVVFVRPMPTFSER
jgi:hypothetical protein